MGIRHDSGFLRQAQHTIVDFGSGLVSSHLISLHGTVLGITHGRTHWGGRWLITFAYLGYPICLALFPAQRYPGMVLGGYAVEGFWTVSLDARREARGARRIAAGDF